MQYVNYPHYKLVCGQRISKEKGRRFNDQSNRKAPTLLRNSYFKSILSIKDIETVLAPLRDKYFSDEAALSLSELYTEVCKLEKSRIKPLSESVQEAYESSFSAFSNIEDDADQKELRLFAFICSLSFDVYLKKVMIEKIIDELSAQKED